MKIYVYIHFSLEKNAKQKTINMFCNEVRGKIVEKKSKSDCLSNLIFRYLQFGLARHCKIFKLWVNSKFD